MKPIEHRKLALLLRIWFLADRGRPVTTMAILGEGRTYESARFLLSALVKLGLITGTEVRSRRAGRAPRHFALTEAGMKEIQYWITEAGKIHVWRVFVEAGSGDPNGATSKQ